MLKKILASLALIVGVIHPSIASEIYSLNTAIMCSNLKTLNDVVKEYGEIPFAVMTSYRSLNGDQAVPIRAVLFVNPNTKTYTFAEQFADNTFCVVSIGENLKPYIDK